MKKFLILTFFLILLIPSINVFAQDEEPPDEPPEEFEPWQVSEIKFSFQKTKSFTNNQLDNIITTSTGTDLNINSIVNDIITLKKFYFDNGFFNTLVDTLLQFNKEENEVTVIYTIIENDRSRLNQVKYTGLDSLPQHVKDSIYNPNQDQLQKLLKEGEYYSRNNINLETGRIVVILQNNGYAFAKKQEVKVTDIFSADPNLQNKVDVEIYFYTGKLSKFGETYIKIEENKYGIDEKYIRRNLEYSPGQIYDKRKIDQSNARILANAIIESSNFTFRDSAAGTNGGDVVDLNLNVTIRNKYELTPEVLGYEIDNRFYGGLGLGFYDRFFLNSSRTFNASLRGLIHSFKFYRLESFAQVSQSYLFNSPHLAGNIRLGVNFFTIDSIDVRELSAKASVSYDLPAFTYINKLIASAEILNQNVSLEDVLTEVNGQFANRSADFDVFSTTLGLSALHIGIDNPVFPTRGFNQTLTAQEGGLLGQLLEKIFDINVFKFLKFTASNKIFFNLSDNLQSMSVLGLKFNAGIIIETGDNIENIQFNEDTTDLKFDIPFAPIDLRFTAGGGVNNRGWRANTLGMVADPEDGGNFSIDGTIEHRLRPFINSSNTLIKDLGFVYFLDYGNVWQNVSKFRADEIALSTGFGIRYFTIIGAVRLDLGLKLYDPRPGHVGVTKWIFQDGANLNDKYTIQFGIGNTF
jgi:outer membrane protein assembly factor BamA